MSINPFFPPTEPRSGLEALRWLIFEYPLFEKFEQTLSKKQALLWNLRIYIWVMLFSLLLYLAGAMLNIALELPLHFPSPRPSAQHLKIIAIFDEFPDFFSRYVAFIQVTLDRLAGGLAIGLAFILFERFLLNKIEPNISSLDIGVMLGFAMGCVGLSGGLIMRIRS